LIEFSDGELGSKRAEAFRDHLRSCEACMAGLVDYMQYTAQLSTMKPSTEDECQTNFLVRRCGEPAPLLLHVSLPTRNVSIETMLVPVCERCYQAVIEDETERTARVIRCMIPPHRSGEVVFWTREAYDESWSEKPGPWHEDDQWS
jgi:hypothetical protein